MIDSHHHLWKYTVADYGWMNAEMTRIKRDFLPESLEQTLHHVGIQGAVAVQARQSLEETTWLLDLADKHDIMRGVVGWVPLIDPTVRKHLENYKSRAKLRGIRHVLHDEADDRYMLRKDFNTGVGMLQEFGLRYDILIKEHHLPQTLEFVDRHPRQIFIVDHVAKPKIREHVQAPWNKLMKELARRENVYCKLSGMVTEADWEKWTPAELQPYIDVVLAAFGPKRVMYGSDWPVVLVASDYSRWFGTVTNAIASLSATERDRIMGGTAIEAYGL